MSVGEVNLIKKSLVKYNNMYLNESKQKIFVKSTFISEMADLSLNIDGFLWFVDLKLGITHALMRTKRAMPYSVERC